MPTMPDSEAGHILTNLYGAGAGGTSISTSGPARPPASTSQFQNPLPPNQQQHSFPPPSSFSPVPVNPPSGPQASFSTFRQTTEPQIHPDFSVPPAKRSRSRPTKSCEQCRKKKLKCNRELPCSQCLKGGRDGRTCHFEYGPEVDRNNGRDEDMERGLKRFRVDVEEPRRPSMQSNLPRDGRLSVESLVPHYPQRMDMYSSSQQMPSVPGRPQGFFSNYATYPTPDSASRYGASETPIPAQAEGTFPTYILGRIHVKGRGSRFVGNNDRMAMLEHFEDVKAFIFGSFKDPELSGMIHELFAFQKTYSPKHGHCAAKVEVTADRDVLMNDMFQSIPQEFQLAIFQEQYVTTWETISRVLHIPTIAQACKVITQAKSTGHQTLPAHIRDWDVVQVLCIITIASRLYDPSEKVAVIAKRSEDQISKDLAMIQKWVDGIHGKAKLNVCLLETRVLLLIARHANMGHPLELWREVGDLVRGAMILGLHKDAETCQRMPKFQKEMRRKLWMTLVEMDIRLSLNTGMPPAMTSQIMNTTEIINVDDEELREDIEEYPVSKPSTVWTQALPQIALAASVKDRLDVAHFLGGVVNIQRDAPLILQHAKTLEAALRSLPNQFKSSTKAGNISNKQIYRLFTSIMLDVSIRRPLLALYRVIALSPISSQYPEATAGALRNSLAILAHLDALDPAVADLSTVKSRDYLNLFHLLCKPDIIQAAMILCYQIRSFNVTSRSPESDDAQDSNEQEYFHEGQTKQSLTRVVENTLESMLKRIGEYGSDLKEVLPLSVLLQSVRADGTDAEKKEMMVKGAERVLAVCRQILPSIRDAGQQSKISFEKFHRGHSPNNAQSGPSPHPATPDWNPPPVENPDPVSNGVMPAIDDFNLIPGEDPLFQNLDFDFGDWDLNQAWV